ncbi:DUF1540 domain-containing protein [Mediterraneibacter agrestimuris]|uniref:DUF1540 domain-containing protein n=1 Tax=Mediterraneibacter agrestimuris TaxID=2941333 RepID=UPI00203C8E10|nr:DUF1540 domain-containing protein [Mediterraneibacter agrestimuris]
MPQLKCTVQTCVHNKQFLCDLDAVQVGGEQAKTARETCCDSFQERKGDVYTDVTGTASDLSNIDCKATDCMYNEKCECHAGKISVEGSNACHCGETECATFECKH